MAFLRRKSTRGALQNTNLRLIILCFLCSFYGCLLVFSANYSAGSGLRGVITQIGASVIGLVLAFFISHIDYEDIGHIWPVLAAIAVIPVLLTFTPLGLNVGGTDDTAWLKIGFGSFYLTF